MRNSTITFDLDRRERVLLHLLDPLDPQPDDITRTTKHMAKAFGLPASTMYRVMEMLESEGLARSQRTARHTERARGYSGVWKLTENGRVVAEAIRERAQ